MTETKMSPKLGKLYEQKTPIKREEVEVKQKLQNIKHVSLQLKYTYIIHTFMHYFSFPKSNPNQPNGLKVLQNPNKKIINIFKKFVLSWTKQR